MPAAIDPALFPRLADYLRSLPLGLDSYPECRAKSGVLRGALVDRALPDAGTLPEPLARLVESPPLPSSWVPEVHRNAIFLAYRDRLFASDDAYLEWIGALNRRMFESPLYKILAHVASPQRLLRGAQKRFEQFRIGTTLELEQTGDKRGMIRTAFPARLHTPLTLREWSRAFEVVAEAAGGKNARTVAFRATDTRAEFEIVWD
jgi:hypothetical protein